MGGIVGERKGLGEGILFFFLGIPMCLAMAIARFGLRDMGFFDMPQELPVDASDVPPYAACGACRHPVELANSSDAMRAKAAARLEAVLKERDASAIRLLDTDDATAPDKPSREGLPNRNQDGPYVFDYSVNPIKVAFAISLMAGLAFWEWNSPRPTDRFYAIILGGGAIISFVVSVPAMLFDWKVTIDGESITVPRGWFSRELCRLTVSQIQSCQLREVRWRHSWSSYWKASIRTTERTFTIDSRYCSGEAWDRIEHWLRKNVEVTE